MFLDASSSSRYKAGTYVRTCQPPPHGASRRQFQSLAHECAGGKNYEVHPCSHAYYAYDNSLTKGPKSAARRLPLDVLGILSFYSVR
jgi:hypothetical protein